MHLRHLDFYIFVCGLTQLMGYVKTNDEDYYDMSVSDSSLSVERSSSVEDLSPVVYSYKYISVERGSNLVLTCSPHSTFENSKWLHNIEEDEHVSVSETGNGISLLSLTNLTDFRRFNCSRSKEITEVYVINVHVPEARISNKSPNIVTNGTNIHLTCVVNSINPPDTAYLQIDTTNSAHKYITTWESRKRICMENDYNRTDCVMETTFQYNVKITDSGNYICGYERAESESVFIEVLSKDPIIYEATVQCTEKDVQEKIVTFAIEALEKFGLNQNTTTYIRQKCNDQFGMNPWNCIIGRHVTEFSLSPDIFDNPHSSFRFSLGSIFISVFRTNK